MQSPAQAAFLNSVGQALLSPRPSKKASRFRTDTRRYAIYFGSKASLEDLESDTDADSTWEFSAPITPFTRSSSDGSYDADGRMTPAQQIIVRYRANHSSNPEAGYSSPSIYSEPESWATASMGDSAKDLKAIYRESRYQALQNTLQEAINVATMQGVDSHLPVACPRTECRDQLPNLKALAYHLHIHEIHDHTILCTRCESLFEDERAMAAHVCERPKRSFARKAPLLGAICSACTNFLCLPPW